MSPLADIADLSVALFLAVAKASNRNKTRKFNYILRFTMIPRRYAEKESQFPRGCALTHAVRNRINALTLISGRGPAAMMRTLTAISALALLTACGDGQPFFDIEDDETPDIEIELDGTEDPESNDSINRIEPDAGNGVANATGGGLVRSAVYDEDNDTYDIDNLAFDGLNTYSRDTAQPTLGGYPVYAAEEVVPDFLTGGDVDQVQEYRLIAGRSNTEVGGDPRTSFAIVRTGGFSGFGFGGFVYERNGGVTLPTSGQAQWDGTAAGIRVFDPIGRLEFTEADAFVAIDFDDFNTNNGITGSISNRRAYDVNGNRLPDDFAPNPDTPAQPLYPDIQFVILQGVDSLLPSGEFTGELRNSRINEAGQIELYEDGEYFGIIAGDATAADGGEVVGVYVVQSEDPRLEGVTVQETGGFVLERAQP